MNLLKFELLKLGRSKAFLFINSIPIITLIIALVSFLWRVDQDLLEQNTFFYKMDSYVIANPFYNYQSRFFGLLYMMILPIYIASAFSYSSYLDIKNNAYRLYANASINNLKTHFIKFISVFIFFVAAMTISYILLAVSTVGLPYVKADLVYTNYQSYVVYSGVLMLKTIVLAIPTLILHYWISLKLNSPTINVVLSLVILLITFMVFNQTPYFYFIKGFSDSLTLFKLDIIDVQPLNWKSVLFAFDYELSVSVFVVAFLILLCTDLYSNWWNKLLKNRKYIQ